MVKTQTGFKICFRMGQLVPLRPGAHARAFGARHAPGAEPQVDEVPLQALPRLRGGGAVQVVNPAVTRSACKRLVSSNLENLKCDVDLLVFQNLLFHIQLVPLLGARGGGQGQGGARQGARHGVRVQQVRLSASIHARCVQSVWYLRACRFVLFFVFSLCSRGALLRSAYYLWCGCWACVLGA
jgi:hypothetical protein